MKFSENNMNRIQDGYDPDSLVSLLSTLPVNSEFAQQIIKGIMLDDCCISTEIRGHIVATTDYLNYSPICVELGLGDETTLGRLAVAASVSDLIGTGAIPMFLLAAIALPRTETAYTYLKIMQGVASECVNCGIALAGGDSKISNARSLLTTAVGHVASPELAFTMDGARPGDSIWVSGQLGSCAAAVLAHTKGITNSQLLSWAEQVLCVPALPVARSKKLASKGIVNGGTDISDGVVADLRRVAEASEVSVVLDIRSLPIAQEALEIANALSLNPKALAFPCGGEYQFLVTCPSDKDEHLRELEFTRIGEIREGRGIEMRNGDRKLVANSEMGHRDFRRRDFAGRIWEICSSVQEALG